MAVDPQYADNHWIYLFYSAADDEPVQHVSRFVLEDDSLHTASEKILLKIPTQREECCHSAGSLEFGPDGNLFIAVGDNTNPRQSDGYGPTDERPGRSAWDAQKSSSNTNDLRGKILRITPQDDGTYVTPEDNLFSEGEGRPEIYVMGNRNPYRISIDARSGDLYWGEVGPDASKDSVTRGPRGYDEINRAPRAGNYGWPYFVADNQAYHVYDFATQTSGEAYDAQRPVNRSPNNTGQEELPPAQPALIYYPYGDSEAFPMLGSGARNAMAGPVYYHDDYDSSGRNFPNFFDGKLMIYDWMRQWIFLASLNETGVEKLTPFVPNTEFNNIIDMTFGPDGALYLLEYGSGWYTQNPDAKLARIEYAAGNRAPLAKLGADRTIGGVPLTVHFTGRNSLDYDADSLAYSWSFGANEASSTETNPIYTFEKAGVYPVRLTVTDQHGESTTTQTEVLVGNELPTLEWTINAGNQTFYWPNQPLELSYAIAVDDAEDGSLAEGTIDPRRVMVSFDYLPEGNDRIEEVPGHANLLSGAGALAGKALIAQSDCGSCHQEDTKSVGPAYRAVAERYRTDPKAATQLAGKIIRGGSGSWGEVPMAAHPSITSAQARQMADYILSLSDEPTASAYPPQGTYRSQAHREGQGAGSYVLTARYTDRGGRQVGPLSVQQTLTLRHPRREAETYDLGVAIKYPVKAANTPGLEEDITVVLGQKGKFFAFSNVDLSGVTAIKGQFALVPGATKGGRVAYRLDGPDGTLMGTAILKQSLTKMGFVEPVTPISPVDGQHDVYVVFDSDSPEEGVLVTVANWIEFMN